MPESARSSPLFPLRTPDPASTHPALPHPPDPRYPGLQATPRRLMHQSRNVSACPAPLMTHRHIYFAGTLAPTATLCPPKGASPRYMTAMAKGT
jgi:hypothetical protein